MSTRRAGRRFIGWLAAAAGASLLGCGGGGAAGGPPDDLFGATDTPFGATDTAIGATDTPFGATDTAIGATDTPFGATDTPFGATDTAIGATDTAIGATDTAIGATDVPLGEPDVPRGGAVVLSGVTNARQVGGLPTADGRRVRTGVLVRSGELAGVGEEGCAQLRGLGVRTVVDLRSAAEVATRPDAACVTGTVAYSNADLPKILPPSPEAYLATLDAAEPRLAAIFEALAGGLPGILHCVIGRDRAGIVTAIVLLGLGVPRDVVLEDFVENQDVAVEAVWLEAVLDRVDSAGGIGSYLARFDVAPETLERLRSAALEP